MAKPKAPDPVAYAKSMKRDTGGRRCATCADAGVVAVIRKWIPLWNSGDSTMSIKQAHAYLRAYHGYTCGRSALSHCVTDHQGYKPNG
jgi:hypothetical protein